jgi:voltage-gated potassium channel
VYWLVRRKFLVLLITLSILVVVYPLMHATLTERLVWDVLFTGLALAVFLVIFTERHMRLPALLLGIPTVAAAWIGYTVPGIPRLPAEVGFHLVAALFFSFTVGAILRHIYRAENITSDSVYGAFCGYVLVGLAFGHLYCVIESLKPGSFQMNVEVAAVPQGEDRLFFLLSYFSLVTLTTVGYGDVTPVSHGARGVAVVEAILGQFYIAVLIGELIGKRVASALAERR